MRVRNTSKYPTDEIKVLLDFASGGIDTRDFWVCVDNRVFSGKLGSYRKDAELLGEGGRLFQPIVWKRIFIHLGKPLSSEYRIRKDWRRQLIYVSAHEFRHAQRIQDEKDAHSYARKVLKTWTVAQGKRGNSA